MAKQFRESVEIISTASGLSGLKLTNLPAGTVNGTFNGVLGIDGTGNVIKIDTTKIATVTVAAVAPVSPVTGQQWLNTSVSPSELMIWNGTSWEQANDEVQHYANFAAFPVTGDEDVVYIDDATDNVYLWDSTTSAYVDVSALPTGLFSITDGTTTQPIAPSDTITFAAWPLLKNTVTATDTVTTSFDTTGATTGQVPSYNGTNVVWANADNIYTANGTLTADRTVTMSNDATKNLNFVTPDANSKLEIWLDSAWNGVWWTQSYIEFYADTALQWVIWWRTDVLSIIGWTNSDIEVIAEWQLRLDSSSQVYRLVTAPTVATTQTQALVRDASTGRLYLKDLATLSSARYANTWTPTVNVETVHTHALTAWEDVVIQVRDATTKEIVDVEIRIISATTFGVTSTTVDPLRVIAL